MESVFGILGAIGGAIFVCSSIVFFFSWQARRLIYKRHVPTGLYNFITAD
jgi:hypothetical protein